MQIQINKPCTEQWDGMQPNANGRHCDKCCKTVIDFSTWEVAAIADYLKQHSGQRICGRVKANQLQVATTQYLPGKFRLNPSPFRSSVTAVMLMAISFTIVGCTDQTTIGETNWQAQPVAHYHNSNDVDKQPDDTSRAPKPPKPPKKHIARPLIVEEPHIQGDMILIDIPDSTQPSAEPDSAR